MSEIDDLRLEVAALRRSEAQFRALVEKSSEAISLTSADGVTFYRNPTIARLLGWTAEEMLGRPWIESIFPADRQLFVTAVQRLMQLGEREITLEFRAVHRDGSVRWMAGSCTNLLDDPDVGALVGNFRDVTTRKEAEHRLQLSEQRFRRLVEDWPEPVIVHIDNKIAYANPSCAQALGLGDPRELIGRSIAEFAAPSSRAELEARMTTPLRSGEELALAEQTYVRSSDGREVHVEVKSILIDFDGRPATLSISRDMTGRVLAERATAKALQEAGEAARERERLLATLDFERRRLGRLLAKAPAYIAVFRGEDHILELLNEAYQRALGDRELLGRPLAEALPAPERQGLVSLLDRVLATGEPHTVEAVPLQLVRRPGSPPEQCYVNFAYQAMVEADGVRSGVFAHGVDVTDATLAQQRVRAQFHGVPVPMYVWQRVEREGGRQFVLVDYNRAALAISRGEIATHLGESGEQYFADVPEILEEFDRCLEQGVTLQREMDRVLKSTGETKRLFVTYAPAPPDLVLVHAEDVTERRSLELQLQHAQKMEAVGRLAGGVAHDFNNLLSVILSYAELAMEDLEEGTPLRDDLAEIQAAGQRATNLTRQLLAFSRQQVLQPQPIVLSEVISNMRSMLGRLLGEDIELAFLLAEDTGTVLADPGQIEQVVMNLAVNARDAMPEGGKLTIETANVEIDEDYVGTHLGVAQGHHVMLAISDTGEGMDAATRAHIFEPFFTTKEQGKGTGLGLATVFGIVQQSGGHIGVYSEPGHGSAFKVYLPRTDRVATAAIGTASLAVRGGSETILLVEDAEQVRTVACMILRRHGYHVLEASNGAEACLVSSSYPSDIQLLLTDVVMPRMSGRRLAEQLAPQRPGMKVLFASGYTDDAVVRHGVLAAGMAFLQKPFTPDALLRKVREVLDAAVCREPPGQPPA